MVVTKDRRLLHQPCAVVVVADNEGKQSQYETEVAHHCNMA